MTMPIEGQALERVQNDSSLNIDRGRIAALKALMEYVSSGVSSVDDMFVPDISQEDQRLADVCMTSYNSIRNAWIAMYEHWKYPDIFVVVQGVNGSVYTQVNRHVHRSADHTQATLF